MKKWDTLVFSVSLFLFQNLFVLNASNINAMPPNAMPPNAIPPNTDPFDGRAFSHELYDRAPANNNPTKPSQETSFFPRHNKAKPHSASPADAQSPSKPPSNPSAPKSKGPKLFNRVRNFFRKRKHPDK
jgi:hypothetical protein